MAQINPHFNELKRAYIFPIIDKKLEELRASSPGAEVLNLGVGDIALPLAPTIVEAICKAAREMGQSVRGYGPAEGDLFLREAICREEYGRFGISPEEIFISDGAKRDVVNIQDLFSSKSVVAIPDPAYPAYLDASILVGKEVVFLPCTSENRFLPLPPSQHCDLVYLCTPGNPTGMALGRRELEAWVDYARRERAVLLVDHAYEAFIRSPDVPRSIYEIEGALEVAIEIRSFSKSAGFTGLRCGYTALPKQVVGYDGERAISLQSLWNKRQRIKETGLSYPIQRGAEAALSESGKRETRAQVESYVAAAKVLREGLQGMGLSFCGGEDAPYIWWKAPSQMSSWEFFDFLLKECQLICVPGVGFGSEGEGYVRLSTFASLRVAEEAIRRIKGVYALCR